MYTSTVTQFDDPPKKRPLVEDDVSEPIPLPDEPAEQPWLWTNIISIALLHVLAIYAVATSYRDAKLGTWIFSEYLSTIQCA